MNRFTKTLAAVVMILSAATVQAKVALPNLFTDHMVLQQKSDVKIWGSATPLKTVSVTPSWSGITYNAPVDKSGKWSVTVATPAAGGPFSIFITEGRKKTAVTIKDVLIGEVWICTGQSNMEMRIGDKVIGMDNELAEASSLNSIRLFQVEKSASPVPEETFEVRNGGWQTCSASSLVDFSAAGYFFGKILNQKLNVPIGLIQTCWGGTVAEAWTSKEAISEIPYFRPNIALLGKYPANKALASDFFEKLLGEWEVEMKEIDPGFENGKNVWGSNDYDDSSWLSAGTGFLQTQGISDMNGFFWMRKRVELPASWEGKPLTLHIGAIDDNDYSYFNGVCVGHTEGCILHREYSIPAGVAKAGWNTVAVRVMDTGGMSGIFGEEDNLCIVGPDGKKIPLTGEWKVKCALKSVASAPPFPVDITKDPNYPSLLYNAMINPLVDYKIRGSIWYQGESNTSRAAQYKDLLPLMITDWRTRWGYDFPFYIAQIANFMDIQTGPEESDWARLREAQLETLRLENTGLAVLIDIGETFDIHPKNKKDVGYRLALNALHGTYGFDTEYQGPLYQGYTLEKGTVRVRFTHTTGGILAKNGEPEGFYIAGADHVFHKAKAVIDGDTIVVSSPEVSFPVAVRYAWANNPVCNIYNGFGLPASPFRTDSW